MTDQVCVVVGGGKGMGAAIAREMKKRNYRLSLMSPSDNCENLAEELDGIAYRGRAETSKDTDNLIKFTMEKFGRIDSLLIHVGGPPKGDLLEISEDDWKKANEMVLMPVIRLSKLITFEPSLMFPTSSVYRVGVSSYTKLYSDRYGSDNIRMNCLLPGFTDSLDLPEKLSHMSVFKRFARVEEQAKTAAFLLSDDSSYITGQSISAGMIALIF